VTRSIDSPLGLAWVAFCSAVAAALATGMAIHDPAGTKIAVALLGTAVGLVVALVSFALVSSLRGPGREGVGFAAPARPESVAAPVWVAREPAVDDLRVRLEARLAAGRELRDDPPDARVDEWIETTRRMLEPSAPGAARYFAALDRSAWPAQLARLETIVRDFL
jgi:hypothetical protein